jgi:hypothetical protein
MNYGEKCFLFCWSVYLLSIFTRFWTNTLINNEINRIYFSKLKKKTFPNLDDLQNTSCMVKFAKRHEYNAKIFVFLFGLSTLSSMSSVEGIILKSLLFYLLSSLTNKWKHVNWKRNVLINPVQLNLNTTLKRKKNENKWSKLVCIAL